MSTMLQFLNLHRVQRRTFKNRNVKQYSNTWQNVQKITAPVKKLPQIKNVGRSDFLIQIERGF